MNEHLQSPFVLSSQNYLHHVLPSNMFTTACHDPRPLSLATMQPSSS